MLSKQKEPKDLGVKIVSEKEALWTKVRDVCTNAIKNARNEIEIQEEMLKIAEAKIKEEKDKV